MANYNTSNITDAGTPAETLRGIAGLSDAVPISLLFIFFVVPFVLVYRRTRKITTALNVAGFVGFVMGAFEWAVGIISFQIAIIPLVIMIIGMAWSYWG